MSLRHFQNIIALNEHNLVINLAQLNFYLHVNVQIAIKESERKTTLLQFCIDTTGCSFKT
jgi:hypothetical protein